MFGERLVDVTDDVALRVLDVLVVPVVVPIDDLLSPVPLAGRRRLAVADLDLLIGFLQPGALLTCPRCLVRGL